MTTRAEIVAEARDWVRVRTPVQHQGRLKGIGADCIGVPLGIALGFGLPGATEFINDIRFKGYSRPPNPRLLLAACEDYLDRVPIEEALPGDIPICRIGSDPQHFAIITSLDPIYIVHAYQQVGRVVENRVDERMQQLVVRMYRYRGLED